MKERDITGKLWIVRQTGVREYRPNPKEPEIFAQVNLDPEKHKHAHNRGLASCS